MVVSGTKTFHTAEGAALFRPTRYELIEQNIGRTSVEHRTARLYHGAGRHLFTMAARGFCSTTRCCKSTIARLANRQATIMELDPLLLSRLQFAWVIAFHILLPAFTVGLASYVAALEGLRLLTRKDVYLRLSIFWTKIFAVSFGVGVVSGIVMPFQFGTNWSRFSDAASNVIGPLLAYEGLMAFFLEATFLGILLFGRKLVPPWAHFFAALMVAVGTLFSSFWILAVNSWMQTPAGFEIKDGLFYPADWWQAIFNPSFPYRLIHTVNAFYATTALVVVGVAAYYLRHNRFQEDARTMLRMGLAFLTVVVPLQIVLGDLHGVNTFEHQPAKVAAMEGNWETQRRMPATLFAIPNENAERNDFEIAIPAIGSLYLTHDLNGVVKGLKEWPRDERPPVTIVFFAFRVMVGLGLLMLALVGWSWWLRLRGRLTDSPVFLRFCIFMIPAGFIAVLAGWTTTEVGRQPWVIYGHMRTAEGVSPSLTGIDVLLSLLIYMAVYLVVFGAGAWFLARLIRTGPQPLPERAKPELDERPARPLSAATRDSQPKAAP
jgi:cytochrome bd ubiquinol oxidase subunit I